MLGPGSTLSFEGPPTRMEIYPGEAIQFSLRLGTKIYRQHPPEAGSGQLGKRAIHQGVWSCQGQLQPLPSTSLGLPSFRNPFMSSLTTWIQYPSSSFQGHLYSGSETSGPSILKSPGWISLSSPTRLGTPQEQGQLAFLVPARVPCA